MINQPIPSVSFYPIPAYYFAAGFQTICKQEKVLRKENLKGPNRKYITG